MSSLTYLNSQNYEFKIPDDILHEMKLESYVQDSIQFNFKIVYPIDYDSNKKYDVVFALSGGNANEKAVEYSYYAIFKSHHFENKIVVMPINNEQLPLHQISANDMLKMIEAIKSNLPVFSNNWILLGTSNGGIATFRFAYISPDTFSGIIVIPGALSFNDVHEKWANYRILLACGENDEKSWLDAQKRDLELLSTKVENVFMYKISGEGHILSPTYNQDLIYDLYFNREIE